MAYKYTTTRLVLEVGDKVTPDWVYFDGSEVMTPGRVLTVREVAGGIHCTNLIFEELSLPYPTYMFRLIDNTNIREVPL